MNLHDIPTGQPTPAADDFAAWLEWMFPAVPPLPYWQQRLVRATPLTIAGATTTWDPPTYQTVFRERLR